MSHRIASAGVEERSMVLNWWGGPVIRIRSDGRVAAVGEATSTCGDGGGIWHASKGTRGILSTMVRIDEVGGDVRAWVTVRRAGGGRRSRGGIIVWRCVAELRWKEATII